VQCAADLAALGLTSSPTEYGPDELWSYELGAKARFLNKRLSVYGAAYQIDWTGIQQGVALSCGFGYTTNAGEARIRGAEIELSAMLADGLRLASGVGYIDGKLTQGSVAVGSVADQRLQTVPKWSANAGLTYTRALAGELSLFSHVEYIYTDERFNGGYLALTPTPSYELVNARAGVSIGRRWSVNAYVNNIFDERAPLNFIAQQATNLPFYDRAATNQPLTVGLEIRVQY